MESQILLVTENMNRRKFLAVASASSTFGLAGCVSGFTGGTTETVTVGSASGGSTGLLMEVVLSEDLDAEHGIEIETERAPAPQVTQLLVNEAVDIAYASPQGTASANTQGRNIRIFGPWLADHNSLMALPDSDIEGWEDLREGRLGILPEASGTYNHTSLLLAEAGMSLTENFDLRTGNPGAIHSFNQNEEVDAHLHFPPVSIKSIEEESFREVKFLPNQLEELYGRNLHFVSLAAYEGYLSDNPEIAEAVRSTLLDAADLINEDAETHISNHQDFTGFENDQQVQLAAKRAPPMYPNEWTEEDRNNIVSQLERSKEVGIIPDNAPTDVVASL